MNHQFCEIFGSNAGLPIDGQTFRRGPGRLLVSAWVDRTLLDGVTAYFNGLAEFREAGTSGLLGGDGGGEMNGKSGDLQLVPIGNR